MRPSGEDFDATDLQIIEHLQEDGRRSYREISRSIGVSEATVRARVQRLQDAGTLRITAYADPFTLGNQAMALVFLKVRPEAQDEITTALVAMGEVVYVSGLIGSPYHLCTEIIGTDLGALADWVRSHVDTLSGVVESLTWVEHEVFKLKFRRAPDRD